MDKLSLHKDIRIIWCRLSRSGVDNLNKLDYSAINRDQKKTTRSLV